MNETLKSLESRTEGNYRELANERENYEKIKWSLSMKYRTEIQESEYEGEEFTENDEFLYSEALLLVEGTPKHAHLL